MLRVIISGIISIILAIFLITRLVKKDSDEMLYVITTAFLTLFCYLTVQSLDMYRHDNYLTVETKEYKVDTIQTIINNDSVKTEYLIYYK